MTNKRSERVIERLRREYPGDWHYDLSKNRWIDRTTKKEVYACWALSPRFDGDDNTFELQLRWGRTGELVGLLR